MKNFILKEKKSMFTNNGCQIQSIGTSQNVSWKYNEIMNLNSHQISCKKIDSNLVVKGELKKINSIHHLCELFGRLKL